MDFFETVKDVAGTVKDVTKDTALAIAKKSGELVEASKVQYAMFELKNDIKKLYSEIGRLTYLAVEENEDHAETIKDMCDIAAAKLAKLEVLRSGKTDEGFVCPSCGRKTDGADTYCPSCGADMAEEAQTDVEIVD